MNSNLSKYLHEVFRNEVKDSVHSTSQESQPGYQNNLHDQGQKHFVLDKKYALQLDEII